MAERAGRAGTGRLDGIDQTGEIFRTMVKGFHVDEQRRVAPNATLAHGRRVTHPLTQFPSYTFNHSATIFHSLSFFSTNPQPTLLRHNHGIPTRKH